MFFKVHNTLDLSFANSMSHNQTISKPGNKRS